MQEFFTNLIVAIICGLIAWVAKAIIPYIEAKLESSRYSWAADIIEHTVRAYEQIVEGSGQGEHKYRLVVEQVTAELDKLGIHLTDRQISTLIEAAVQSMNAEKFETSEICNVELPVPEGDEDEQV